MRREKEIKAGRRASNVALIEPTNPGWQDLSLGPGPLHESEIELIEGKFRSKPTRDFIAREA
jgi:hypothetical protein